jgi:hypothetical protein
VAALGVRWQHVLQLAAHGDDAMHRCSQFCVSPPPTTFT